MTFTCRDRFRGSQAIDEAIGRGINSTGRNPVKRSQGARTDRNLQLTAAHPVTWAWLPYAADMRPTGVKSAHLAWFAHGDTCDGSAGAQWLAVVGETLVRPTLRFKD